LVDLCDLIGDFATLRDSPPKQNVTEDDDLEVPETPPKSRLGKEIPAQLAIRLVHWLKVEGQLCCPGVHRSVEGECGLSREAGIGQQTIRYVVGV
jgi:hypothetical protein